MNQVAVKPAVIFKAALVTVYRRTEVPNIKCRKCGVGERALCGGQHSGLYGLWKAIVIDNFMLFGDLII
jgi:hypothetical protein